MADPNDVAADEKPWSNALARAAFIRLRAFRTDSRDGRPMYFSFIGSHTQAVQAHPDLASLLARIRELEERGA